MFDKFMAAAMIIAGALIPAACIPADRIPESLGGEFDTHSSDIVRFASDCEKWDEWEKPARPFHIYGGTYYVGTCGIAAILITSDDGHILIDTGTRRGAEFVLENIRSLGFDPADIDILLHSHEHFDHVGGMAFMQSETGADLIASKPAATVFFSGQDHPRDPQYGVHDPMETVVPLRHIENGESVTVGAITLKAVETPGHTPGALTWQWESCENGLCETIVYADSLSPVSSDDYRFSDHREYIADYRAGLDRLAALDCDILLTPHPSHSRMIERAATGTFRGGVSCADYADGKRRDLDARLGEETGATP